MIKKFTSLLKYARARPVSGGADSSREVAETVVGYFTKLSDVFFYANSYQSICNKIEKNSLFKNNIPIVNLSIKDLEKNKKKNIKNFEEYNANILYFEKTGINSKFIGIDKISIIRKIEWPGD